MTRRRWLLLVLLTLALAAPVLAGEVRYQALFLRLQRDAREARRGLWKGPR